MTEREYRVEGVALDGGTRAPAAEPLPPEGRHSVPQAKPLPRFLAWLGNLTDPLDATKLEGLARWALAGFTTLSLLLTFLGIKEGYLDRILGENLTVSLWVFLMLGSGVLLSLISAALHVDKNIRVAVVVGVAAILSGITFVLLSSVPPKAFLGFIPAGREGPALIAFAVVSAVVVILLALARNRVPAISGLLTLAILTTSMGLYSAIKVSVASKTVQGSLRYLAETIPGQSGDTLRVTVKGSRQAEAGLVTVYGVTSAGREVLGSAQFNANEVLAVDEIFNFRVALGQWQTLEVESKLGDEAPTVVAQLSGETARSTNLSTVLLANGDVQDLTVSGSGLAPGGKVYVLLFRNEQKEIDSQDDDGLVMSFDLMADGNGSLRWTASAPRGDPGDWTTLAAGTCETLFPKNKACRDGTRSYAVLAPRQSRP